MTPAQAYGHPDFVTDWPVQGPTDPGIRAADCWYAQNVLPAQPSCVDCNKGPIPMWAQRNLSPVRGNYSGIGRLAFGGVAAPGFLAAAGDPEIWTKISAPQQQWVADTIRKLNDQIVATSNTTCPNWNPSNIASITGCFQVWFNANYAGKLTNASGSPISLRADGVFDQQTLDALRTVVGMNPKDFPTAYPGTQLPGLTGTGEGLSKGAMYGIAAAGAAVLAGAYYMTKGSKKSRRRR